MAQGTLEEWVAYLEGKVEEQSRGYRELREEVQRLTARVGAMDQRLSARIDALDQKVDRFREELSSRVKALDQKVTRQFMWTVGVQVAVLLAVVGAPAAALFRG